MSDIPDDDRGGETFAGEHPDEDEVPEMPHPDDDVEDES